MALGEFIGKEDLKDLKRELIEKMKGLNKELNKT